MVYKNGPKYRERPVDDIKEDILEGKLPDHLMRVS
jgi:hypothetical protein